VSEASVVEADPQGYFEESALAAVQNARFVPGSKAGRVVKSRLMMELTYAPRHAATGR
jgi:protein TonB